MINRKSVVLILVCILLSACGSGYVAVDGIASAKVFTWEDLNQNGIPDNGEHPIPYVTTSIGYPDVLTASDGWGAPTKFKPGCSRNCSTGETVTVKVPPGYKPTTPTHYEMAGDNEKYYFGFYPENKNAIIFFSNEPEWQRAFINRGIKLLAFHYSDNKTLEITIDRDGTIFDDYYPKSFLTDDDYYYDVFIFDIILELRNQPNVDILQTQIKLMPSNSIFSCNISEVEEWDGRISGYEILTQHCEKKK